MFTRRERTTILAALVYWREEMAHQKPSIQRPYFKAAGKPNMRPLSATAIAQLAARLRKERY